MRYLFLFLSIVYVQQSTAQSKDQYVLLISFDGFRHDYVEIYPTPNFDAFIKNGVASHSLIPSFPSKTFPNHYTLVTGLYPANHGLVDNTFYDKSRNVVYSMSKKELVTDAYYYGGLPLWQHAQENGLKTASYFWVGSEAPVSGNFPTYYYNYDGSVSNKARIKQVRNWLEMAEEERPRFISLYFSLVDSNGHRYGPESPETGESVQEADRLLGLIRKELSKVELPVNVIITSDHGMVAVKDDADNLIELEKYLKEENEAFLTVNNSTHAHLYFNDKSKIDSVYHSLKGVSQDFDVHKKGEFPQHWHYNIKNDRIGDLIITADIGKILSNKRWEPRNSPYFGVHGYDPQEKALHGIFYANGPAIIEGATIASFENIHVYPLVCLLLGIPVPENIDGEQEVLEGIVK